MRLLLLLPVLLVTACGATPPLEDPGLAFLDVRGDGDHEGIALFELREPRQVAGREVDAGTRLAGLRGPWRPAPGCEAPGWVYGAEFEAVVGAGGLVFARRPGDATFTRLVVSRDRPPLEEPTRYQVVSPARLQENGSTDQDRWLGVDAPDAKGFALLGPRGETVTRFEVERPWKGALEPLGAAGVFVVHHRGHDQLHRADGQPISPRLAPLWSRQRFAFSRSMTPRPLGVVRAAVIHGGKRPLLWPLGEDGKVCKKPDDLIGLEPLETPDRRWYAWRAWWRTPEGERCALLHLEDADDPAAIASTREQARWTEWHAVYDDVDGWFVDIVRGDGTGYEVRHRLHPRRTFDTLAEAQGHVAALEKEDQAALGRASLADLERAKAEQRRQAAEEEARRQAELRARQAARADDRRRMERLMASREFERARLVAWQLGRDAVGEVVLQALAAGEEEQVTVTDLETALPYLDRPLQVAVRAMIDARNGSPSSDPGPGADAPSDPGSVQATRDRIAETDRRNLEAWLRGAQRWGAPR